MNSSTQHASQPSGLPVGKTLAPAYRTTPLRHGLVMGFGTAISVALSFCCVLSVANRLGPGYHILNTSLGTISILAGCYVGFRAWQHRKLPRPDLRGRCRDCGRELITGQNACSLCGREIGKSE